jgi:putative glutamine amidotransferase
MSSLEKQFERLVLVTTTTAHDRLVMGRETVLQCLYEVGLIPVLIHAGMPWEIVSELLQRTSGLVLTGGPDIDPKQYGQEQHPKTIVSDPARDTFELAVVKIADQLNLPILGICRGAQILWVSQEGQLIQEVSEVVDPKVERHGKENPIYADLYEPDSRHEVIVHTYQFTARIFDPLIHDGAVMIPSMHHQAVDGTSGTSFKVAGESPEGIIEIFFHPKRLFQLALQGHPEALIVLDEFKALPLAVFGAFARATKEYQEYVQVKQ